MGMCMQDTSSSKNSKRTLRAYSQWASELKFASSQRKGYRWFYIVERCQTPKGKIASVWFRGSLVAPGCLKVAWASWICVKIPVLATRTRTRATWFYTMVARPGYQIQIRPLHMVPTFFGLTNFPDFSLTFPVFFSIFQYFFSVF